MLTYSHDFPWHSAAVLASAGGVWLGFVYMALRLHAADVALKNAHRRFGEERMTALRRCYGVLQKKARKQVREIVEVANRRLGSEVFRYDGEKLTWEEGIEGADESPDAGAPSAPGPNDTVMMEPDAPHWTPLADSRISRDVWRSTFFDAWRPPLLRDLGVPAILLPGNVTADAPAADEPTFADDAEAAIEAALPGDGVAEVTPKPPLEMTHEGTADAAGSNILCSGPLTASEFREDISRVCDFVSGKRDIGWFSAWCKIAFDRQWGWSHGWKIGDDTGFWYRPAGGARFEGNDPLKVAHAAQAALRTAGVILTHDLSLEQPRSWLCPNVDCPHVDTKDYILDFVKKCNICPVCREETKWVDWGSVSGEGDESGWVFMDETAGDLLAARSLTDRWWSRSKKDAAVLDRSEARDEASKAAARYHYLVPAHTFVAHRVNAAPVPTASAAEEAL